MTLFALKEWDAQVQALLRGEVALVLRKGGIREIRKGFEVTHERFLLYPTYLHQNAAELRAEFQSNLHPDPQPGTVHFPALAEVAGVWKVEDLGRALALEPLQALSAQAITSRFRYKDKPWLHAVLLRVKPLSAPFERVETREMLGCVSWVPLDDVDAEVQTGPAVLGDDTLADIRAQVEAAVRG